jgi:hypothetical protein
MVLLVRRFCVLAALLFWQGGFTFYAAVVVPVGQEVLGSHLEQGLITRHVTNWLNVSGAVALPLLAWDLIAADRSVRRRWARAICWFVMLLLLGALVYLHPWLDAHIDPDEHQLLDAQGFHLGHRWYLWLSTIQWGCSIAFAVLSLGAWQAEDGRGKE